MLTPEQRADVKRAYQRGYEMRRSDDRSTGKYPQRVRDAAERREAERERTAARKLTPAWKQYHTQYRLAKRYGLTQEQLTELHVAQHGKCDICERPIGWTGRPGNSIGQAHIDHCHTSGKVRALLCGGCNSGLGHFQENVVAMKAAIAYLEKHT